MEKYLKIYKITFESVGHGHKPTKQIAATDVESAIKKAKEMIGKEWGETPIGWCDTIGFIDGIAE